MAWKCLPRRLAQLSTLAALASFVAPAQWIQGALTDSTLRADYVIIAPRQYAATVEPLAAMRAKASGLSVAVVLMDSITSQFHRASPDSAIRDFVTSSLTRWRQPRPRYLLLAGNVNVIPSHRTPSPIHDFGEYSVPVDQWFVDALPRTDSSNPPAMALGRMPAWNEVELSEMVNKTVQYAQVTDAPWQERSVAVAQEYSGEFFEQDADSFQRLLAPVWGDTVMVHTRRSSPRFQSKEKFREIWNSGAAMINFVGRTSQTQFADTSYFSINDIDSLAPDSPLAVCTFPISQRFDTLALSVALLKKNRRGAVCTIAPSGLSYYSAYAKFQMRLLSNLAENPNIPIGIAMLLAKQSVGTQDPTWEYVSRHTLLGDPALIVKHSSVTGITESPFLQPAGFCLLQNYPNPFNPSTTIRYGVPKTSHVKLAIYNTLGQQVSVLLDGEQEAGYHDVQFNASRLASGVYFYRLQAGDFTATKRLTLLR